MQTQVWLLFVALTVFLSVPFYIKMYRGGGARGESFRNTLRSLRLIPGIVAFIIRITTGMGFKNISLGFGHYPWILVAALVFPIFMEVLIIFLVTLFKLEPLDRRIFSYANGKVRVSENIQLLLGNQNQSFAVLIINIILTVSSGALFILIFSLFEEFGWRGLMQPELTRGAGVSIGLVINGVLWALWLFPIVWMGYLFPEQPKVGAFALLPIWTVSVGMVLGFSYWFSGSLWVPALLGASIEVSDKISEAAFGNVKNSVKYRFVWLWIWAVAAGVCVSIWESGILR